MERFGNILKDVFVDLDGCLIGSNEEGEHIPADQPVYRINSRLFVRDLDDLLCEVYHNDCRQTLEWTSLSDELRFCRRRDRFELL